MNNDTEFLRAQNAALVQGPMAMVNQDIVQMELDYAGEQEQLAQAESQYNEQQQAGVQEAEIAAVDMNTAMAKGMTLIEDADNRAGYNAAMYDEKRRAEFGGKKIEGLPISFNAARQNYATSLHYANIADEFQADEGEKAKAQGSASQTRDMLVKSYQSNFGLKEEEAIAKVDAEFGFGSPVNFPTMGTDMETDPVQLRVNRYGQTKARASQAFVTKAVGNTFLNALEQLSIVDAPLMEAGYRAGADLTMSDEQLIKYYPHMARDIARLQELEGKENLEIAELKEQGELGKAIKLKFKNFIERSKVTAKKAVHAIKSGGAAAGQEAWRLASGGEYTGENLDDFVKSVSADPGTQEALKKVMPFVSFAGIMGAELAAARMARKSPDLFFTATSLGRTLDMVVPGRKSAWTQGSGIATSHAIEESLNQEVKNISATLSDAEVAQMQPELNPDVLSQVGLPNASVDVPDIDIRTTVIDQSGSTDARDEMEIFFTRNLGEAMASGDYTTKAARDAGKSIVDKIRNSNTATEADLQFADSMEAQIQEAMVFEAVNYNKTVGVDTPTPEVRAPDEATQALYDTQMESLGAKEVKGQKDSGLTHGDGSITISADTTLESMLDEAYSGSTYNALDMLGYSKNLLKRLVTNDEESKLFVLLHEKAHRDALDFKDEISGWNANKPSLRKNREELAMMNALSDFSAVTGKPFHDVVNPVRTPGGRAQYDPSTGRFFLRAVPAADAPMPPAPPEIAQYFYTSNGPNEASQTASALGVQMKAENPVRIVPIAVDGYERVGIHPDDFSELGEIFRLGPFPDEAQDAYNSRIYNAFVNRYAATNNEIAQGLAKYTDMTPEMGKFLSAGQISKIEQILNSWRGIKNINYKAMGTDQEINALDLALWFRSEVADQGKSYRIVYAKTKAEERAIKGAQNGQSWSTEAAPMQTGVMEQYRTHGRSNTLDDYDGGSVTADSPQGMAGGRTFADSPDYATNPADGRTQQEINADLQAVNDRNFGKEGATTDMSPSRNRGMSGDDLDDVPAGDAMTKVVDVTELPRDPETGMANIEELTDVQRDRLNQSQMEDQQPLMEGPTSTTSRSLAGTPEQLRALDLEEFAGVGINDDFRVKGKINVFRASAADIDSVFSSIMTRENGAAEVERLYTEFIDGQIADMASTIAVRGADESEMLLFHRSMGTAKAISDVYSGGSVKASTESWLNSMNMRVGIPEGLTAEQALIVGMNNAKERYGFAFNMQKDRSIVVDTQVAEIFNDLPNNKARAEYVTKYADIMSGEKAVTMRSQLNKARKKLIDIVGGECA